MTEDEQQAEALRRIETYISEQGQATGTVSGQMARDAVKTLRRVRDQVDAPGKRVWYAFLTERCVYDLSAGVMQRVAFQAAQRGYMRIETEYGRTDVVRMGLALGFKAVATNPRDTLVMLDVDHDHPANIITRLVAHDVGVVAPLMFRRGEPYEACAFRAGGSPTGSGSDIHHLATFPPGLYEMAQVGTGAIAIQRWVFDELDRRGLGPWYFRYDYRLGPQGELHMPSEDMHFGELCRKAGIKHYVDLSFESPHVTLGFVDKQTHLDYWADHPPATGPTALRLESDPQPPGTQISQISADGAERDGEPVTNAPGIPPMGGEA